MSNEKPNRENETIDDVHLYGILGEIVILCDLQKDKPLLHQLVQTTKTHLRCDQPSVPFIFMHKGKFIDKLEKSTAGALKVESKDQILAIS